VDPCDELLGGLIIRDISYVTRIEPATDHRFRILADLDLDLCSSKPEVVVGVYRYDLFIITYTAISDDLAG